MKKKVFILACLILGVVSVYQKSQTQSSVDDFLLMNVEALATSEYMDNYITCKSSGDIVCPIDNVGVEYVYGGYSLR